MSGFKPYDPNAEGGGGVVNDSTGWAQYADTTSTVGSPQVVSEGNTDVLLNDGANTITSNIPAGVTSLYDGATNKLTPDTVGDAYLVRVSFTAYTSSQSGFATLSLDIGAPQGVILSRGFTFPKGAGLSNAISLSTTTLIYSLDTFIVNGGELKITSNEGDTTIYDVDYVISRTHKGVV